MEYGRVGVIVLGDHHFIGRQNPKIQGIVRKITLMGNRNKRGVEGFNQCAHLDDDKKYITTKTKMPRLHPIPSR